MAERITEDAKMILENWMVRNLEKYGNCVVGKKFLKKHGKETVVETVKGLGYEKVHIETVPKTTETIEINIIQTSDSHSYQEKKKMSKKNITKVKTMFKVGDYVKVIKGLHNNAEGEVTGTMVNDLGTITYEIRAENLYKKIGNIVKKEGEIEMAKRGRPAKTKTKKATKLEQLKELTKEVVEMTEAEPTSTVGEPAEVVDEVVETVDEVVETVDEPAEVVDKTVEEVDEAVEEPKRAYDQLLEAYDVMRRSLNVNELELFSDIVMEDVKASKYVLEQMYQMSIEQLIQIRKEFA